MTEVLLAHSATMSDRGMPGGASMSGGQALKKPSDRPG
jgi:hypothetical protein